jgi:divalent metal cation (Fe/Co/Zn/Cd) transporter
MPPVTPHPLTRSAGRVSVLSAVWTVVASSAGIWVGIEFASLALIAFGVVGILDAAGSVTLALHFGVTNADRDRGDRVERVALAIITAGLVSVGVATAGVSVLHLVNGSAARQSDAGIAIAGASMAVLTLLALRKRWLAVRIPSHALLADSHLSAIGAVLAVVTLAGTVATSAGWTWADPAAALCVAVVAARLGVQLWHAR